MLLLSIVVSSHPFGDVFLNRIPGLGTLVDDEISCNPGTESLPLMSWLLVRSWPLFSDLCSIL